MGLKHIIKKNKAVIKFLLVFFGSYLILALLYQAYLKYCPSEEFYPDYITHQVAHQSYKLIDVLGYETYIVKHPDNPSMLLAIKDQYVARIIEGCNSVSVIILFLSFILAFSKGFKETIFFIFIGGLLIYALNLVRIVLLTLGLYFYPQYGDFMHEILFPLFIYGVVFLLWLYWVNKYKKHKAK
ncbi:exosortase family protein XrtF [Mesohalobacter halotolerans]|uniref:Exosortase family protein XrtF n=1 Tax=Mesohalobacter halotolerans TaxID=1883405 RepID=A0A4U5TTU9_9FLAO|nr:exosortase family protein XrtF [Mesohalobacter halotolerans]MBS3738798.1 exosortase family protein XrtF [Psychroflexus sp.]TKS57512.1 exosortase family protein XrtF [Mesohalobacter halotolerans]